MEDDERTGAFDHLLADAVRETVGQPTYGDWRAISAPDAVSFSYGFPFPDSFPNEELVAAAEAVFEAEGDTALQYGGGEYAEHTAEAIAARARERGIECTTDEVLVTNGSANALDVACHTLLDPGETLFVEAPTYMGSLLQFRNYGVEVVDFPLDGDGLDVEAVASALSAGASPKLVYTIPNFQNPTGTTLSLERRRRLIELAEEHDFLILEDDAYGELRYEGEDLPPLAALDGAGRVIHVGTFSKTIAPGVRTGWAIAHRELRDQMARMSPGGENTFTLSVVGRYCAEGRLEENVADLREAYEERRDHMLACLEEYMPPEADWTEPAGGFFVWVELPPGVDAEAMLPAAAEEGAVYLPGEMFYPDDRGERNLRLSFSYVSFEEMERGVAALARATRERLARTAE